MNNAVQSKIDGRWLGKAIGGTLGTPHEGKAGPLALEFYDLVPNGILPNDDLDLQLVWLHHLLETRAGEVRPALLSEAWRKHVNFPCDEYAVCLRNIAYGFQGTQLGAVDNWFAECTGAAIRSELWACLAPGQPERAVAFAWIDAVCDHAGEGVRAEIFFAALDSAAFVESDRERLLDLAPGFLPSSSRVHRVTMDTHKWWRESGDWRQVRTEVMRAYGEDNFTDVAVNVSFTVLGWLAGGNDFGRSILIATNYGQDTDCTAATLGSILGIIDPDSIPATWKAPIGERIVLSREIVGMELPTLTDLTVRTLQLQRQLADARPVIGEILPRQPATAERSPIRIPVRFAWSQDRGVLSAETPPESLAFSEEITSPGHWLHREAADFAAAVQWFHCKLRLETATTVRLCAWSQGHTVAWVDGSKAIPLGEQVNGRFNAPSPHRGCWGHFDLPRVLGVGEHDFVVAWEAPEISSDPRAGRRGPPKQAVVAPCLDKTFILIPHTPSLHHLRGARSRQVDDARYAIVLRCR